MHKYDDFIFDLDQTLYSHSTNILPQIEQRMTAYCQKICRTNFAEANKIRQYYYHKYGATLTGLIQEHTIDAEDFLENVHHINYDSLTPCKKLIHAIENIKGRKIIYTNGTKKHALNVLKKRHLMPYFSDIYDIQAANLQAKPCPHAFKKFLKEYNIVPEKTIFFDDNLMNIQTANAHNIDSILIQENKTALKPNNTYDTTDDIASYIHNLSYAF